MASINIEDLFEIETREPSSSFIKTAKSELFSHQVFFDEDIGSPAKYRDLINLLYTCTDDHEFNFFMNTSGGAMSSAIAIIEAIKATDGKVRAIIVGECHSAGSIIALNCHEIVVSDSAMMLCHTASYGTGGNTHNVKIHSDFSSKYVNKLLDDTYTGFVSSSEMIDLKKGIEVWFDSEEIGKRLESRLKHQTEKASATIQPKKKRGKTVPVAS